MHFSFSAVNENALPIVIAWAKPSDTVQTCQSIPFVIRRFQTPRFITGSALYCLHAAPHLRQRSSTLRHVLEVFFYNAVFRFPYEPVTPGMVSRSREPPDQRNDCWWTLLNFVWRFIFKGLRNDSYMPLRFITGKTYKIKFLICQKINRQNLE